MASLLMSCGLFERCVNKLRLAGWTTSLRTLLRRLRHVRAKRQRVPFRFFVLANGLYALFAASSDVERRTKEIHSGELSENVKKLRIRCFEVVFENSGRALSRNMDK